MRSSLHAEIVAELCGTPPHLTNAPPPLSLTGPESSPAGSPAPACSQQQVIQHNTITTSTTTVGGGGVHGQANHRTDINTIH